MSNGAAGTTAFVLAGGGSFGAIQVGMLRELVAHGVKPDFVVGSSVGALNGAYFAGDPTAAGVARLESILVRTQATGRLCSYVAPAGRFALQIGVFG